MASYERVSIAGRSYLVCAECRRPHEPGYAVCFPVIIPGVGLPRIGDGTAQSLCGACYRMQFGRMYPKEPMRNVPDTALPGEPPIPFDLADRIPRLKTEMELFAEALSIAKASGGADSPLDIYQRLKGLEQDKAQTEITAPPDMALRT